MYKANTTNKKLRARGQYYWSYYAPNFEKVDGAYCFWSVRACVGAWVTLFVPTVTFKPLKLES